MGKVAELLTYNFTLSTACKVGDKKNDMERHMKTNVELAKEVHIAELKGE